MTIITSLSAAAAIGTESEAEISGPGAVAGDNEMATTVEEINSQLGVLADHVGDLYEKTDVNAQDIAQLQSDLAAIDMTAIIDDDSPAATNTTFSANKISSLLAQLQSDIEAGIKGDAETYTDLGLVEDEILSMQNRLTLLETKVSDLEAKFSSETGKMLPEFLPDFVTGGLTFKGTFDATTDSLPAPAEGENGNDGWMYTVSVGGTVTTASGATPVQPGDTLISDGVAWVAIARVDAVASVNGQTGAVVLTSADMSFTAANDSGLTATDAQAAINEIAAKFKVFSDAFGNPADMGTLAALKARINTARTDGVTTAAA